MSRKILIPLSELQLTFYVRRHLNQDHMFHLAELYDAGEELPPLTVSADRELIDGRHRFEALKYLDRTEAPCVIIDEQDRGKLLAMAMQANVGGSLPPSRDDIVHTIQQMLENGTSRVKVAAMFATIFPKSVTRRYLDDAQSNISKARMRKAMTAIADGGLTTRQAAEQFGVDLAKLQAEIRGTKRQKKLEGVSGMKGTIASRHKSLSLKNAALVKKLIEGFEDGEVTGKTVHTILTYLEHCHKQSGQSLADWRRRFEALRAGDEDAASGS